MKRRGFVLPLVLVLLSLGLTLVGGIVLTLQKRQQAVERQWQDKKLLAAARQSLKLAVPFLRDLLPQETVRITGREELILPLPSDVALRRGEGWEVELRFLHTDYQVSQGMLKAGLPPRRHPAAAWGFAEARGWGRKTRLGAWVDGENFELIPW